MARHFCRSSIDAHTRHLPLRDHIRHAVQELLAHWAWEGPLLPSYHSCLNAVWTVRDRLDWDAEQEDLKSLEEGRRSDRVARLVVEWVRKGQKVPLALVCCVPTWR